MDIARSDEFSPDIGHFRVVSPESVEARHDQDVSGPQPPQEPLPGGAVKVLPALLVGEDIIIGYSLRM